MEQIERLTDEIRQIRTQYRAEITGGRKQWPKAIKDRVLMLRSQGVRLKHLAERTGLPYHTLALWSSEAKRARFREITVVPSLARKPSDQKIVTVTVPRKSKSSESEKIATVTVTTPEGFLVQVRSVTEAASVVRLLRQGS